MLVQRGLATLTGTSLVVNLDTPVPIGKSYPEYTAREAGTSGSAFCTVTLTGEENGYYTSLTIQRTATGWDLVVSWEVVTGDQFTVQTGWIIVNSSSVSAVLDSIDTTKAFPVVSFRTEGAFRADHYFLRAELAETSITLKRSSSSTANNVIARYYVVEMEGATVTTGEVTIPQNTLSVLATIPEIPLDKTYLRFGWSANIFNSMPGWCVVEGRIMSSTQLRFERGSVANDFPEEPVGAIIVRWYLVQHNKLLVQGGRTQTSNVNAINVSINDISKEDRTVIIASSSNTGTTNSYIQSAMATARLTSAVSLEIKRDRSGASTYTSWFVVEWIALTPPVELSPDYVAVMPNEQNIFRFKLQDAENPEYQQFRYRESDGEWIELEQESYTGHHVFPSDTFSVGLDYEWAVRYWEAGEEDPSDWATATFNTIRPVIQNPVPVPDSRIRVQITTFGGRLKSPYGLDIQLTILISANANFTDPTTYTLPAVESGELAVMEHGLQEGGTWYVRLTATDTEELQTVLEYSFFAGEYRQFIKLPSIQQEPQQATHVTVRVRDSATEYTAIVDPAPPPDRKVEWLFYIQSGTVVTCQAVAEAYLAKLGRPQVQVSGRIPLAVTLWLRRRIRVVIPPAGIDEEMILRKKTHKIDGSDKATYVDLGDIMVSDNELITRILERTKIN